MEHAQSFAAWLSDQRGRADAVGRLASAVAVGERAGHAEEVLELARVEWRRADLLPEIEELRRRAATAERVRVKVELRTVLTRSELQTWDRFWAGVAKERRRSATKLELSV